MERAKKLSQTEIDLINQSIYEIHQYTDPRHEKREDWKGLAVLAVTTLVNIPEFAVVNFTPEDKKLWQRICQSFDWIASGSANEISFSWLDVSPLVEEITPILKRYGFKVRIQEKVKKTKVAAKPKIMKKKPERKITEAKTNRAIANLYLYTLWHKDQERAKGYVADTSEAQLNDLAADALWYLSSFGNDSNHEALLTMEEALRNDEPTHFNWTQALIAIERCGIQFEDPLVWIEQNKPFHLAKLQDGKVSNAA